MTQRDEMGGGFRMGTRVHPWQMHVDVWQNQYNIVKLIVIIIIKLKKNNRYVTTMVYV